MRRIEAGSAYIAPGPGELPVVPGTERVAVVLNQPEVMLLAERLNSLDVKRIAKRMREQYPYRVMEAKWRESAQGAFRVTIAINANDSAGLVNQITEVVSRDMKLNIRSINLNSRGDGTGVGTISVEVPSVGVVDTLIHAIMRIKGVQRAYRVKN